jgi:hypothetical protein
MNWSWSAVTVTAGLGATVLHLGTVALAQDEVDGGKQALEEMVEVRSEGNDEAATVQKRIDTVSDQTDELLSQYRTTLKQIDSIDTYNAQIRKLIDAQQVEIDSLKDQVGRVQGVGRSVTPLMLRMVEAMEKFVALDVPFLIDERTERVEELRSLMGRADVTTPEKFRSVMEAYQIESEYGRTIEAYRASLEVDGRETTVDFMRFGRIALVYQSLDETQRGMWSQTKKTWIPLDTGYQSAIRQGLRIARKQAAPDLIRLPLPAATDKRGSS